MRLLLDDIGVLKESIESFLDEQDGSKIEYVKRKYEMMIKRAIDFKMDCSNLEGSIPEGAKNGYETILIELKMLEGIIKNKITNTINGNSSRESLSRYIKENRGFESKFGEIKIEPSGRLGEGGNGVVYSGQMNATQVAIKFLVNYNSNKYTRFRAEYFNLNLIKDSVRNTVNNIHYDELITESGKFPYIIMKKYCKSLRKYYGEIETINWKDIKRIYDFLLDTLSSVHKKNVIHRDIKPENILIDENDNYILADFGISHFEKENFPITNKTKQSDRLANFEFSAPEQIDSKIKCTFATDIYSMAQIIYWFAFGEVHKGTGIRYFQENFEDTEAIVMSQIIHRCLQNKMEHRFQTIEDIASEYGKLYSHLNDKNEYDPFPDMYIFNDIMSSTNPDFYRSVSYIDNIDEIKSFFNKLKNANLRKEIEFNTGIGNNTISKIKYLENGNFLIDTSEVTINKIWGSISEDIYNDICILELRPSLPYIINQKEYLGVAKINDEVIIPVEKIQSGYVRIDGLVHKTKDLKIEERYIYNEYNYMVLGAFHQCSVISKNDKHMRKLQEVVNLNKEIILELKKDISINKTYEVEMRL